MMTEIDVNIIHHLGEITAKEPVLWNLFDAAIDDIEDINFLDDGYEETHLSYLLKIAEQGCSGAIMTEAIRRFLAKGYDVKAHDGRNGGLCLEALCCSTDDKYILDSAKLLLKAGSPNDGEL